MTYRRSEVKAGLFVIVSVLILLTFIIAISGLDFKRDTHRYLARFRYVGGITRGSLVRVGGMEVGRVTDLRIPADGDSRVEVVLEVRGDAPIRVDSEAFITTIGLMGAFYVEITLGSPDAPLLPSGSTLKSVEVTAFAQMSGSLASVSDRLNELVARLNRLLGEQNQQAVASLLQNANALLGPQEGELPRLLARLNGVAEQLQQAAASWNETITDNEQAVRQAVVQLPQVLAQSMATLASLEAASSHLDELLIANGAEYVQMLTDLRATAANLEELSRTLRERPWSILRASGPKDRELPD
ncbi:MAG: MCE family protein [Calditrichaeota bacterium]|nr:MCE family protein [Calditrichota bacterium]